MRSVGLILAALAAAAAFGAPDSRAEDNYPWCAQYFDGTSSSNCGFGSEAQCRASVQGVGGICLQNNRYIPAAPSGPQPGADAARTVRPAR